MFKAAVSKCLALALVDLFDKLLGPDGAAVETRQAGGQKPTV